MAFRDAWSGRSDATARGSHGTDESRQRKNVLA